MSGMVVIAGGGPTGLTLAGELRLAGVTVCVIEPRTERPQMSQGMAIHTRTLEALGHRGLRERIGDEEIFQWPRTPFSMLWLDMEKASPRDFTHAFPQWRTERLLLDRAEELGADIRRGHRVDDFRQDETGVTVTVRHGAESYELRCDYLVGADGAESQVRKLAGIEFTALGKGYYGVFGDMDLKPGEVFDAGVYSAGIFGAMPLDLEVVRLMTLEFTVERPSDDVPVTKEELASAIGRITGTVPELGEMRWLQRFGAPTRLAERYRQGRVLLAGDAAHSLFISGTQGLNTGIHDALNLGWKLAATLNGWAPDNLLDTYQAERHPVGQRMTWHAQTAQALLHPLEKVGQLRELIGKLLGFEDASRHMLQLPTRVRYPLGPADGTDANPDHPLLGTFLPDTPLTRADGGTTSLSWLLQAGRGILLDLSGGTLGDLDGWTGRVDVVAVKADPEIGATSLLVRPDGYVAHADAGTPDRAALRAALTRWFGEPTS